MAPVKELWSNISEAEEVCCINKPKWILAVARKQSGFGEIDLCGIDYEQII